MPRVNCKFSGAEMFQSVGNHLHFEGNLKGDVLNVIGRLHNLIHKQGYQDIILDFSKAGFLSPAFMLPIVTACRAYRREKVEFSIIMPENRAGASIMSNANWAHLIIPEQYDSKSENNIKHISATQFFTAEEHHKSVDKSIGLLLQLAEGMDRNRIKALEWSLNEITDNVLNHSESPVGGVMQVVTYPQKKRVELIVCDAGITIQKSLRSGRPSISDDATALRQAIEEGVTKNTETNQGNGLFGTFKCCEVSGGEFEIMSGYMSLHHKPREVIVKKNSIPYSGTMVRAVINTAYDELLEKALVFRGRAHDPGFDYVERMYQADGDTIRFNLSEELNSFGSRESGRLARVKVENLMDRRQVPVEFDFIGIHLISSSFADEVFGKLFAEIGPIGFSQLCHFKNVDRTVQGLIDRAIMQRMRVL